MLQFEDHLLVTTSRGEIAVYPPLSGGASLWRAPAAAGNDALNAQLDARAYLVAPPRADFLGIWRNRLIAIQGQTVGMSMDADDPNVPSGSPLGGASVWPVTTNFSVLAEEDDEITAFAIRYDKLELYTQRSVFVVDEDETSPAARRVAQQRGCIAPASHVNTGTLSFFLSDGAVCSFDGTNVAEISSAIPRTMERINWIAAENAVGVHYKKRHEYRLWVPIDGEPENNLCLIYNYQKNRWRLYAGWYTTDSLANRAAAQQFRVTAAASVVSPAGEEIIMTGDADGNLWIEDVGLDDGGDAYPACIVSQIIGKGSERFAWGDLRINCKHDGSILQGRMLVDGETVAQGLSRAADCSERALHQETPTFDATPAWGFTPRSARFDNIRFPFAEVDGEVRLLLSLPGSDGAVTDLAQGAIRWIELSSHPRPDRHP
jgi:hypothetical protein